MDNEIVKRIENIEKELICIKNEIKNNNEPKAPFGEDAKVVIYNKSKFKRCLHAFLKEESVHIGDKVAIPMKNYILELVIVDIRFDNTNQIYKYYLMATNNIDALPMDSSDHAFRKFVEFKDTDMHNKYLPRFMKELLPQITAVNGYIGYLTIATLASKEEIFDEDKAFPYFKVLFKEGVITFIREFGHDSYFWLRSNTTSNNFLNDDCSYFHVVTNNGLCRLHTIRDLSIGFRPLIILGE